MKAWRKRLRSWFWSCLMAVLKQIFGRMTWRRAQWLGARLGDVFWFFLRRERARALEHLAIAFPEKSAAEHLSLARASLRHLGCAAGEMGWVWARPAAALGEHVRIDGFEVIEEARAGGRPIVLVTGHCGNWELIAAANHSHGLGLRAMVRHLSDPAFEGFMSAFRRHLGSRLIRRGGAGSVRELRCTLREGGALVMLIDQDIRTEGAFVPFFGRPAHTPLAAAHLALRLGAVVVPTFSERRPDGSHVVRFEQPLALPAGPEAATALMTAYIEKQIRRCPEQWVWMHRRWRQQPPKPGKELPATGSA